MLIVRYRNTFIEPKKSKFNAKEKTREARKTDIFDTDSMNK